MTLGWTLDDLDSSIFLNLDTRGSTPGTYIYVYAVAACSEEPNGGSPRTTLTYTIETEAVAAQSRSAWK